MIANRLLLNRLARAEPVNAHVEDDAYNKRARNNAEPMTFDKEPATSSEKEAKVVIANKIPWLMYEMCAIHVAARSRTLATKQSLSLGGDCFTRLSAPGSQ